MYGIRLLVLQAKLSGIAVGDGWIDPINMIPGQHTLTLTRTRTRAHEHEHPHTIMRTRNLKDTPTSPIVWPSIYLLKANLEC